MTHPPLPEAELQEAVAMVPDWSSLRGARVFITGGTGFIGKWLLEVLGAAVRRDQLEVQAVVLSRHPERFLSAMPHLRNQPWLQFHQGDAISFELPPGRFTHVLHGAASSDARDYDRNPLAMQRTQVEGTRRVANLIAVKAVPRALLISSGAVYSAQPPELLHLPEDHPLSGDSAPSYAQGKRESERLFIEACMTGNTVGAIARCFAFGGPHLPLDQHYAFGNFIQDALQGRPIEVQGDGSPYRSYLYASELAAWLWTLLLQGEATTYHVGSDQGLSIRELAQAVGEIASLPIQIQQAPDPGRPASRYVPAILRIPASFGLRPSIPLKEAIVRTLRWHRG